MAIQKRTNLLIHAELAEKVLVTVRFGLILRSFCLLLFLYRLVWILFIGRITARELQVNIFPASLEICWCLVGAQECL